MSKYSVRVYTESGLFKNETRDDQSQAIMCAHQWHRLSAATSIEVVALSDNDGVSDRMIAWHKRAESNGIFYDVLRDEERERFEAANAAPVEDDDDPQCVCGVCRSEHALCGCSDGFQRVEAAPEPEPEPESAQLHEAKSANGTRFLFTDERIVGIVYPHATTVVPTGAHVHEGPQGEYVITVAERGLLALPAATGTPTERRATLERAFDSSAERLAYSYGAMRVDPACSAILDDLNTAIADDWHARPFWPERIAA